MTISINPVDPPFIIVVAQDDIATATDVVEQITRQMRERLGSGVLLIPEGLAQGGADRDPHDFVEELSEVMKRPVGARPGVPTAPPASPSGVSHPGTGDPFAVLGYTRERVRQALNVAASIVGERTTGSHPDHPIHHDAVILRALADRA